ncbi:MAG: hypothetical protein J6S26_04490 [Solobacterium sp.]|nr:hypothetical protein [Solobacterium sp.]
MKEFDFRDYIPGLLCFAFLLLGFGTGTLGIVLSVAWAYVAVKIVNHFILKRKKPEDRV